MTAWRGLERIRGYSFLSLSYASRGRFAPVSRFRKPYHYRRSCVRRLAPYVSVYDASRCRVKQTCVKFERVLSFVTTSRTVGHVQRQASSGNGRRSSRVCRPSFFPLSFALALRFHPCSPRGRTLTAGQEYLFDCVFSAG